MNRRAPLPGPALALTALLAGVPVSAQAPDSVRVPHPDSVYAIAPLQVEVLRSSTQGARVPYAVSGLDPSALATPRVGAFLNESLVALPGLQVQNRYNFAVGERLMVRGFGARSQFGVRGLKIYFDGIPATLPDGQSTLDHVNARALSDVELLRGPAAALYGNGAGGVLLMRSRRPAPGQRVELDVGGGSNGLLQVTGAGEFADADQASRVQISRLDFAGFRANPVAGGTYGEAERWTFTGTHERELWGGRFTAMAAGVELDAENPGSLPADSLGDPDRSAWAFNVLQGTGKEVRQLQLGTRWQRELEGRVGDVDVVLWGLTRDVVNPIPNTVIDLGRTALGGRAALGGQAGLLRWDVGVEVDAQRDDRRNFDSDGGTPTTLTLSQDESVTGVGTWAALRADGEVGSLHAALRYDRVAFSADDRLIPPGDIDESGERTLDAWSPSLGGSLALGPARLFGSIATFLQTPTTTELANRPDGSGGFNPSLEPTTGWTAEGGIRGSLAGRLGWELVAFRTELTDELIPFEVPSDPGRSFFRNAGESSYEGVEAALRAAFPRGVSARLAYTWIDARFESGDLAGNRVPGRSPGLLEAVVQREGPVRWSTTVRWVDDTPVNDENTADAPSYWLVDLQAGLRALRLGATAWSPWVSVNNLFDENYVASVAVNAFGGRFFEPGPGRTFQIGVRTTLETGR